MKNPLNIEKEFKKHLTKIKKCIKFLDMSDELKMKISIYSGCDYVDNIKGLGFGTLINQADSEKMLDDYVKNILEDNDEKILPDGASSAKEYLWLINLTFAGFYN